MPVRSAVAWPKDKVYLFDDNSHTRVDSTAPGGGTGDPGPGRPVTHAIANSGASGLRADPQLETLATAALDQVAGRLRRA